MKEKPWLLVDVWWQKSRICERCSDIGQSHAAVRGRHAEVVRQRGERDRELCLMCLF